MVVVSDLRDRLADKLHNRGMTPERARERRWWWRFAGFAVGVSSMLLFVLGRGGSWQSMLLLTALGWSTFYCSYWDGWLDHHKMGEVRDDAEPS